MKKWLELTVDEMNRNKHLLHIFIILLVLGECIGLAYKLYELRHEISANNSFNITTTLSSNVIIFSMIGIGIFGLLIFVIYSWFREWRMQGRFIYRLLTLPGKRASVAWAKWTSIILMGLEMVAVQTFLYIFFNVLLDMLFPSFQNVGFKAPLAMELGGYNLIMPVNFMTSLLLFLMLSFLVLVLSNIQLIFMSQVTFSKLKAVAYSLFYILITIALAVVLFIGLIQKLYLLPNEREWAILGMVVFHNLIHGFWMHWFMNHSISV